MILGYVTVAQENCKPQAGKGGGRRSPGEARAHETLQNQEHDLTDDASVNLVSVSIVSLEHRRSSA